MGAGTLDVSILEIDGGSTFFEVKVTGGEPHLGGVDMDKEFAKFLVSEYKSQNGSNVVVDETVKLQINHLAEKIKIELSEKEQVLVNEVFFSNDIQTKLELKIIQNDFEKIIEEPILKKCEQCIYKLIE